MTLTSKDKNWIKQTIIESLTEAFESLILPRFEAIDGRFDEVESNIRALRIEMISVKKELKQVKGRLMAVESDVKELYYLQAGSAPSPA